jgi:hypothetical protein
VLLFILIGPTDLSLAGYGCASTINKLFSAARRQLPSDLYRGSHNGNRPNRSRQSSMDVPAPYRAAIAAGSAECHASGPCQNHSGLTFIAAAIIRLTSPDTARWSPGANGVSRRYSAVAAASASL